MEPRLFRQRLLELAAEYETLHAGCDAEVAAETLHAGYDAELAAEHAGRARDPTAAPPETLAGPGGDGEGSAPDVESDSQGATATFAVPQAGGLLHNSRDSDGQEDISVSSKGSSPGMDFPGGNSRDLRLRSSLTAKFQSKFEDLVVNNSRSIGSIRGNASDGYFSQFVKSRRFTMGIACLIIMSTILIGIETQILSSLSSRGSDSEHVLSILLAANYILTSLFTMEMVARIFVFRWDFFVHERLWNFFDMAILLLALFEVALELLIRSFLGSGRNLFDNGGTAKMLRLFRLTRLLRLVRTFRQLKPLRMLVHSIMFAARSVCWALLLLLMIVYAFGVVLTQAVTEHTESGKRIDDEELLTYYGDLYRSMLSLWMAVSGGISWIELTEPLRRTGNTMWIILFLIYIVFVFFFILNVVTGVFCQNAFDGAQEDLELTIEAQLREKQIHVDRLGMLFREMNNDMEAEGDGITAAGLHAQMMRPKVQSWFKALDVDTKQTWKLFKILDTDRSGRVALDEFVDGCLRLRGPATVVDVESLKWEIRVANFRAEQTAERLSGLIERLGNLRAPRGSHREDVKAV